MRASLRATTAAVMVCLLPGCETWRDLKTFFQGGGPDEGFATLRVEVEPATGVTIMLDGEKVADLSPYSTDTLNSGKHRLVVRGMGYRTFTLAFSVAVGDRLSFPVKLRRRSNTEPPEPPFNPSPHEPPEPPEPPEDIAPPLPPGVAPITIKIVTKPKQGLALDGIALPGTALTLKRTRGHVAVGEHRFKYRVGGAGLLFITLPSNEGRWVKDGKSLKAGTRFRFNRGIVKLKHHTDGKNETFLFRR